jgi:hypothetical protein
MADKAHARARTVFGRRRVLVGGDDYQIEMRSDAVWVFKPYDRKAAVIPLCRIVELSSGQLSFPQLQVNGVETVPRKKKKK